MRGGNEMAVTQVVETAHQGQSILHGPGAIIDPRQPVGMHVQVEMLTGAEGG